jgi:hypothetical protein
MRTCHLLMLAGLLVAVPAHRIHAGSPAKGTAYIGAAFGTHHVYKVEYDTTASVR